jgi:hypothetical protein
MKAKGFAVVVASLLCIAIAAAAQDNNKGAQETNKKEDAMRDCPMHSAKGAADSHHAAVLEHGDEGMGLSHGKTTHHFRMATDGGAIEVTANDASDKSSLAAIRSHLSSITAMFGDGDFSTPRFVHDSVPPGATTMKLLKSKIKYQYEEIASGGRVRMESSDPVAIAAIHDFLGFQISEHQTGDPIEVSDSH